jgi:glycosyltransferase involved in cell wall biosynthesis
LVIFCNSTDREYAIERLGVAPARARVMPNGVPESFFAGPFEERGGSIKIAQIGGYNTMKGVRYGAEALNRVLRRHPSVRMSFLGTGHPPEDVLRDFDPAVHNQITVRPRFGRVELPTLLNGHQIKFFPTLSEGFGVALLEAMACGLAPVTTATPGPRDIVKDGSSGILVRPRDSHALEAALEKVIENPELRRRLRRAAYDTAREYGWDRIARRTLALYEEAASAKKP